MNSLLPEEISQETDQSLLPTPPQDTEQEDVQLVVEDQDNKVINKSKNKTRAKRRQPPQVSEIFLSEEDSRMLQKMNQMLIRKLGIRKNNSFKI